MFVRGLQATYNAYSQRTGFKVPGGELLVFGLACGQIMFAFLLSPETIPPEYNAWYVYFQVLQGWRPMLTFSPDRILGASQVTGDAVKLNRMIERQGKVDIDLVKKIMQHKVS